MKRARIFLVIHCCIFILLLSTIANAWIPPYLLGILNLLSLSFPYLLILHLIFISIWFFKKRKIALIFLVATSIFYNPIRRWINYSPLQNLIVSNDDSIKVISYNVKYGSTGWENLRKYILDQDADIILVQERDNKTDLKTDMVKYPTVVLKTKHKIIRQADLFNDASKGNSFYADVDINGKIIRIVNVYLEPFRLHKNMIGLKDEYYGNEENYKLNALFSRLLPTFRTHEDQIKKIRKVVDNSPYPVILAGDFNSVPNSYEYYNLGENLKDAFMEVGNGSSTSFHDYKFPLRLDYIFTSKSITSLSYKVDYSVKLSDHYPIIAEFLLN
ncbi:MAG: endonuclease/exonuclease/phosphatase family protein [Chryseobacterium sp.]|nr:endonuclease/exonuclease/phosphatase family protein [Candidatus Chryseobacterium enterohippi]